MFRKHLGSQNSGIELPLPPVPRETLCSAHSLVPISSITVCFHAPSVIFFRVDAAGGTAFCNTHNSTASILYSLDQCTPTFLPYRAYLTGSRYRIRGRVARTRSFPPELSFGSPLLSE